MPDIAPPTDADARARASGIALARELEPHVLRLRNAMERGRARRAPFVKVHVDDIAALFALVRLASKASVDVDAVRQLPWWRRLLHALRDTRPASPPGR